MPPKIDMMIKVFPVGFVDEAFFSSQATRNIRRKASVMNTNEIGLLSAIFATSGAKMNCNRKLHSESTRQIWPELRGLWPQVW